MKWNKDYDWFVVYDLTGMHCFTNFFFNEKQTASQTG